MLQHSNVPSFPCLLGGLLRATCVCLRRNPKSWPSMGNKGAPQQASLRLVLVREALAGALPLENHFHKRTCFAPKFYVCYARIIGSYDKETGVKGGGVRIPSQCRHQGHVLVSHCNCPLTIHLHVVIKAYIHAMHLGYIRHAF